MLAPYKTNAELYNVQNVLETFVSQGYVLYLQAHDNKTVQLLYTF